MAQKRGQFTFYESFAVALRHIRKASERCAAYDAIVNYALYGVEPERNALSSSTAIAFDLIRPHLNTSRRKAEAGMKGSPLDAKAKIDERSDKDDEKIGQRSDKDSENKRETETKKEKEKEKENKTENKIKNESEYKSESESESELENESAYDRRLRLLMEEQSRRTGLPLMGPRWQNANRIGL